MALCVVGEKLKLMQDPPEWLKEANNAARELLGVGDEWKIFVHVSDELARGKDWDGECETDATALVATIRYSSSLTEEVSKELVTHEMLHVLHSEVDQFTRQLLQDHKDKQMLLAMYEAHNERFVVRLARALTRNVKEVDADETS